MRNSIINKHRTISNIQVDKSTTPQKNWKKIREYQTKKQYQRFQFGAKT